MLDLNSSLQYLWYMSFCNKVSLWSFFAVVELFIIENNFMLFFSLYFISCIHHKFIWFLMQLADDEMLYCYKIFYDINFTPNLKRMFWVLWHLNGIPFHYQRNWNRVSLQMSHDMDINFIFCGCFCRKVKDWKKHRNITHHGNYNLSYLNDFLTWKPVIDWEKC